MIVRSGPGTFFGLAIHGNYIFWSDWTRRAVLRTNKFTGGDTKVLRADIPHQPMGIIAVAKDTNSCKYSKINNWALKVPSETFHICVSCFGFTAELLLVEALFDF